MTQEIPQTSHKPEIPIEINPKKANLFFGQPHSMAFKVTIVILFELILLLGAFAIGLNVGVHKSRYTYMWAQNYSNNFPSAKGGRMMMIAPPPNSEDFFNAHGLDGNIIGISEDTLIIKDDDGQEKTVVTSSTTPVRYNFSTVSVSQLKLGQEIVILGDPNDQGQFNAKFIRILGEEK